MQVYGIPKPGTPMSNMELLHLEFSKTVQCEKEVMPYLVALLLEDGGLDWDVTNAAVKHVLEDAPLRLFVDRTTKDLQVRAEQAKREVLGSRLVVTSIAADAGLRDVISAFQGRLSTCAYTITLLRERKPVARTQTAWVDFSSRKAAIEAASVKRLNIFGLYAKVSLAVENYKD
ncbi:unnamed protein product [Periconia digitata]|uniref:Uncharacterized protein n=1 Tax=Periconia digitata TaxID=1303443 RepID=A0A9W4UUN5_9PLEO|nr:unnamed protein product [Periconia digitata]